MCICNKRYSDGKSPARITCLIRSRLPTQRVLPRRAVGVELAVPALRLGPSVRDPAIKTRLSLNACFCDRCGT